MVGHGSKFCRKKEAMIAALLSQRNHEEAARTAGVSKRTLNRYLKMPEFQSAYLEARRAEVWDSISGRDDQPHTSVVVPSLTLDQAEIEKLDGASFYEERLLFLLIRLRT